MSKGTIFKLMKWKNLLRLTDILQCWIPMGTTSFTQHKTCVRKVCRNTLRKPQAMPVVEDVSKLRAFILNEIQKLSDDERMKWDHHEKSKRA